MRVPEAVDWDYGAGNDGDGHDGIQNLEDEDHEAEVIMLQEG